MIMAGNTTKKLAVLIDAENFQPSMARLLLAEAANYGIAHIGKAGGGRSEACSG
jgi:hypothetical protein